MARIVLGLPGPLAEMYAEVAERHGHDVAGRAEGTVAVVDAIERSRPDAAVVAAERGWLDDAVVSCADRSGTRLVPIIGSDAGRRLAHDLELLDTVELDDGWAAIEVLLAGMPGPRGIAEPVSAGRVIAVWGPVGSPGRTSIAIAVAAELADLGHTVALADVDTHGASVAPALGLLDEAPGFAAACRLAGNGTLDTTELERIAQRYGTADRGFHVLTGIGRPSRWPELSGERVEESIRCCRGWVDYTVVDVAASLETDEEISSDVFAPRRNGAGLAALRIADQVIAVGAAEPVGLARFLRSHLDLAEVIETPDVTVVMNRVRSTAIGMNPQAQVLQTLSRLAGIDDAVLVPHDQQAFDGAVLAGRTLRDSAPRSPARVAIRAMVEQRLAPRPVGERGRRSRRPVMRG